MIHERDINKSKSKSKSKTHNNNIRKIPDMTNNSGWHISTIHIGLSYMGGNLRRPKILVGGILPQKVHSQLTGDCLHFYSQLMSASSCL